ncbi:TetR/AcrR family transcriptional regulator [Corynebacterium bovis]|uniref:TetR/AcrR family transcriptional regulator n=1 Tax=Corynebacterium bovis TaxID=36808 RepID=UPI0036A4A8E3
MRADAVAKRREILDAAWRLVSDQGVDVPLRAVAQEAGVGIATLYRHFPTRRDLILGLFSEVRDRVADVIDRHRDGWDDDPTATWHSVVHDLAALRTGALATQMMPVAMVDEELMACRRTGPGTAGGAVRAQPRQTYENKEIDGMNV